MLKYYSTTAYLNSFSTNYPKSKLSFQFVYENPILIHKQTCLYFSNVWNIKQSDTSKRAFRLFHLSHPFHMQSIVLWLWGKITEPLNFRSERTLDIIWLDSLILQKTYLLQNNNFGFLTPTQCSFHDEVLVFSSKKRFLSISLPSSTMDSDF